MRFARIGANGQEVEASRAKVRRDYTCPSCHARVRLRSGHEREPHFAHVAHEASPECERYFPSQFSGDASAPHLQREVEQATDDTRLCVDATAEAWHLYVRLPEVRETTPDAAPISAFRDAYVRVCCGADEVARLPGWDVRPRVGAARAVVPPSTRDYAAFAGGNWPAGVDTTPCSCTVRGLEPRGTVLRPRAGEWSRVPRGAVVRRGEELMIVALRDLQPPSGCDPRPGELVSTSSGTWRLWHVTMPVKPCAPVDEWLTSLGHRVEPPTWDVAVLSLPHTLTPDGATRQFVKGSPVALAITPPGKSAQATVTLLSGSTSQTTSVTAGKDGARMYAIAQVAAPGPATVRITEEHEAAVTFEVIEPETVDALRRTLSCIPRLRVVIDETPREAWRGLDAVVVIQRRPTVARIDLSGLPTRVNVIISGRTGRRIWTRLKPPEAAEIVTAALNEGGALRVEVDAGGLGRVTADVRHRASATDSRLRSRTSGWLRNLSFAAGPSAAMPALGATRAGEARVTYALASRSPTVVGTHLRALMRNRKAHTP